MTGAERGPTHDTHHGWHENGHHDDKPRDVTHAAQAVGHVELHMCTTTTSRSAETGTPHHTAPHHSSMYKQVTATKQWALH